MVDPGVGSNRKSVVVKTNNDTYVVTPDNGTLTHIKRILGIKEARILDEKLNRLPNSGESYTFHGRDIYAFTGARLATGLISFEQIGPSFDVEEIVELPVAKATIENDVITGTIDVLDVRYGSLWTNIPRKLFKQLNINHGDKINVDITNNTRTVYSNNLVYARSFADVHIGESLLYINSLDCVAIAINQGSFANAYNIGTGIAWQVELRKIT